PRLARDRARPPGRAVRHHPARRRGAGALFRLPAHRDDRRHARARRGGERRRDRAHGAPRRPGRRRRSAAMKEANSLLIVDDDARFSETLALEFQERGWRVDCVADLDALRALPAFAHRYAVVDLRLRHQNGLDALPLILERSPRARIVVLTGYGSIA